MSTHISIIVVAYNRPQLTRQTLDSLQYSLKDTSIRNQVIVVDNQSNSETSSIINSYSKFDSIRIHNNRGCAAGKNKGVSHARSDLLYLSDNDMYFSPGWLEAIIRAHTIFPEFSILGAFRHPYHGVIQTYKKHGLEIEESDMQVGSSWLLTKQTWQEFGPLDETVPTGSDDAIFCNAVRKSGGKVGAIKPNLVIHCGATDTTRATSPGGDAWSQDPDYYQRLPKNAIIK